MYKCKKLRVRKERKEQLPLVSQAIGTEGKETFLVKKKKKKVQSNVGSMEFTARRKYSKRVAFLLLDTAENGGKASRWFI